MTAQNVESYKILIVAVPQLLEDYVRAFQGDKERKFPFYVQAISSQAAAKELFEKIKVDLVILEHKFGTENNGLQLLAWMKEKQPKTMALIITSDENIGDREKAFELGAFDWVVTGQRREVSADWLLRRVKDALLYRRYEEGIFELKEKKDYTEVLATSATVVDVLDGHVYEMEGNVVYAKYLINGEEHKAAFDIALFQEAGADFQGAQVRFLTVKTEVLATSATDESTPYDLRIELKEEQTLNEITRDVQEKLDRLEQFDNFEEIRE